MTIIQQVMVFLGIIFIAMMFFVRSLYEFDLRLYKRQGWDKLEKKWQDRKKLAVPLIRVILFLLGISLIIFAFLDSQLK